MLERERAALELRRRPCREPSLDRAELVRRRGPRPRAAPARAPSTARRRRRPAAGRSRSRRSAARTAGRADRGSAPCGPVYEAGRLAGAMRFLVTGATGKVGNAVARRLADRGDEVVALVRNAAKARDAAPAGRRARRRRRHRPGVACARPMEGADGVLQLHGPVRAVVRRPGDLRAGERRGRSQRGRGRARGGRQGAPFTPPPSTSSTPRPAARCREAAVADYPKGTAYERSKQHAEELVLAEAAPGHRGRDRQPLVGLRPRAVAGRRARPRLSRCDPPPPAGRAAGRHDARLRRRRRRRAPGRLRAREARRALHPRRRLRDDAGDPDGRRRTRRAAAGCRPRCRWRWRRAWPRRGRGGLAR